MGIVLYESLFGKTPYKFKSDPLQYYEEIMDFELKFPSYFKSEDAKDFIRQLLVKNPNERISDYEAIKAHRFFTYIRWVIWGVVELWSCVVYYNGIL